MEIQRAVRENGLKTIEDVTSYVKAGGGCESVMKIFKRSLMIRFNETPV